MKNETDAAAKSGGLPIAVFVVVAFALAWLIALPLWFGDGLQSANARTLMTAMMFAPTAAALITVFFIEKPKHKARALGLVPLRPAGRLIGYLALGLVLPVLLTLAALVVGSWLGLFPADFIHFSGFQQLLELSGQADLPVPLGVLVASQFLNVLIAALFVNILPALGEEIGWRGWLLPKLLRFGPWPAILLSGAIWGLWHAPIILLGYNYPGTPGWLAVLAMVGSCIVLGGIFGWLRLRGGSVWPAALAHSSLNAAATLFVVFYERDGVFDPLHANITGWSGWIVPAILLVVIVAAKKFTPFVPAPKPAREPAPEPRSAAESAPAE
ncbi:CPBP family intramembrane glutamic endopeptidase [Gulosibacter sp. 10]|uniref:CPBP family intramembrane glutamic endopeptidase n=1 Tax=Gulosibacter sp. 10 TaxID=1255570 RepID=UPI00097EE781|nr:CPBP family intramembrane glutamic endopeptidase [Gulosibacter sp. 10]SJM66110.1 CAAX amino terminal protease family protein [Gulosibacter sp. 10]